MDTRVLVKYAEGNPGAAHFLMMLGSYTKSEKILEVLEKAKGLRGPKIYILYNDFGERNFDMVERICSAIPYNDIEELCSIENRFEATKRLVSLLTSYENLKNQMEK